MKKTILVAFGTRPEYIKLKPLIEEGLRKDVNILTLFTGQHPDILKEYKINPTYSIEIHEGKTRLNAIISSIFEQVYLNPDEVDCVVVQGDTSSAVAVAMASFYSKIPVAHVEAGLRTRDLESPFPEEANRQIISRIAKFHFCPTVSASQNLFIEDITKNVFIVGNTGLDEIKRDNIKEENRVLFTMHRRENLDSMDEWFDALDSVAEILKQKGIFVKFPVHYNPEIRSKTSHLENVILMEPLNHERMIELIKNCKFVISDSGGIQEEANYLSKPVLICRATTEREECLGVNGILCPSPEKLIEKVYEFVETGKFEELSLDNCNIFGDGKASERIIDILNNNL